MAVVYVRAYSIAKVRTAGKEEGGRRQEAGGGEGGRKVIGRRKGDGGRK